jgi:hypothetical protein
MNDFDEKVAQIAVREYPKQRKMIAQLQAKLAAYEKKERIQNILKAAEERGIQLEDDEKSLAQAPNEKLASIETTLKVLRSTSGLKLGEVEEDEDPGVNKTAADGQKLNPLDEFCLDPVNFDPSSIGQE